MRTSPTLCLRPASPAPSVLDAPQVATVSHSQPVPAAVEPALRAARASGHVRLELRPERTTRRFLRPHAPAARGSQRTCWMVFVPTPAKKDKFRALSLPAPIRPAEGVTFQRGQGSHARLVLPGGARGAAFGFRLPAGPTLLLQTTRVSLPVSVRGGLRPWPWGKRGLTSAQLLSGALVTGRLGRWKGVPPLN